MLQKMLMLYFKGVNNYFTLSLTILPHIIFELKRVVNRDVEISLITVKVSDLKKKNHRKEYSADKLPARTRVNKMK